MKKNLFVAILLCISAISLGLWLASTYRKSNTTTHNLTTPSITEETTIDEKQLIETKMSDTLTIIMFHATAWCPACKEMLEGKDPVYKRFMDKSDPRLSTLSYRSFQVDIDTSPLAQKYPKIMNMTEKSSKITGVPTFVFIKHGKEVHREVGSISIDRLIELTKEHQNR